MNENEFSNEFKQKNTFDRESHLKSKDIEESITSSISSSSHEELNSSSDHQSINSDETLGNDKTQLKRTMKG